MIDKAKEVSTEMYEYISKQVKEIMAEEDNTEVIVMAVVAACISVFRLTPAGLVASSLIPLIVKKLLTDYQKEQKSD